MKLLRHLDRQLVIFLELHTIIEFRAGVRTYKLTCPHHFFSKLHSPPLKQSMHCSDFSIIRLLAVYDLGCERLIKSADHEELKYQWLWDWLIFLPYIGL